jgi:hypothetical protein
MERLTGYKLMTEQQVREAVEQGYDVRADTHDHEVIVMQAGICILNRKTGDVKPLVDRKGRLQACYFKVI